MFNKMFGKFLNYVAYIILGLLGLTIANVLYIAWFTEPGRAILSIIVVVCSIIWAIFRVLKRG